MAALGFIETKGLLAAIEAADAMLKAAEVRLLEKNLAGGGLVTITVAGEVSAVQAAVDAGVAAISRIQGTVLVAKHVIARPDVELGTVIATDVAATPQQQTKKAPEAKNQPAKTPVPPSVAQAAQAADAPAHYDISQLKKMSLSKLRQVVGTVPGISLSPEKIASADKKALIEAIVNAYR